LKSILFDRTDRNGFHNFFVGSSKKLSRQALKSEMPLCKNSILELIIVKHVVEGITELIRNLLDLELFPINLVLNVINPEVKENITHCYSKILKHRRKGSF
jgi:hypothetical protein